MTLYVHFLNSLSTDSVLIVGMMSCHKFSYWTYSRTISVLVKYSFWTPSISTRYIQVV